MQNRKRIKHKRFASSCVLGIGSEAGRPVPSTPDSGHGCWALVVVVVSAAALQQHGHSQQSNADAQHYRARCVAHQVPTHPRSPQLWPQPGQQRASAVRRSRERTADNGTCTANMADRSWRTWTSGPALPTATLSRDLRQAGKRLNGSRSLVIRPAARCEVKGTGSRRVAATGQALNDALASTAV